jgi:ABC-type sulfate transport system permease subunit
MSRPVSINPAPLAAASGAAALAVIGLQYVIARPEEDALREFLVVTGLIVVAAAIVFGVVVPRAVARGGSPGTALTLSLLGLLFAAAYWSGIPPVLAIGGIVLARRSARGGLTTAATVVGVLALFADLAVVVADGLGS